jgi:hypothetical protein
MKTLRALLSALLLLSLAGTALADEVIYTGEPYSHDGITVNAEKIWLKKGKLWMKLLVINGTDKLLLIDKNQIQAKLADGRTLSREIGVFAGHGSPHTISPGLSHALNVEYQIGDLPLQVQLQFEHGFLVGGKPFALPPYIASPTGTR